MIDTTTQPNIPYMWALTSAIQNEADKLLSEKRDQASGNVLGASRPAVSLHSDNEVAGTRSV